MKRSPLARKTPMRRDGPSKDRPEHPCAKEPSTKTCAYCETKFNPARPMQAVCSPICARRKVEADKKAERESVKARRAAIKTIPQLMAEADREFAAYIRTRDRLAGFPCISSGKPLDWAANTVDAGHYRSRGAASHLRYNEDNCHAQSKQDNQWKAGNVVEYRIRLVERIGRERVEALEANNTPHKWTRDELIAIKAHFRARRKELEKAKEAT